MKADLPHNESARLEALFNYQILGTLPERDFDDLTSLAAHICDAPIALISLVDSNRQWFKARTGLDVCETSRDVAFCAHALQTARFIRPSATGEIKSLRRARRKHDRPSWRKSKLSMIRAGHHNTENCLLKTRQVPNHSEQKPCFASVTCSMIGLEVLPEYALGVYSRGLIFDQTLF